MEGGRSHRRHALENMDIQSWSIIKDGDGKEFVVKSYFNMGTSVHYDVLLYDGMDVWAEDIDEDTFKKKCKVRYTSLYCIFVIFVFLRRDLHWDRFMKDTA